MENRKKIGLGYIWLFLPLFILVSILFLFTLVKRTSNIFDEYPKVSKSNDINIIIEETDLYKGSTLITTDSENKFSIDAYNWNLKPDMLHFHLEAGDSLAYRAGGNYVFLYKKNSDKIIRFEVRFFEE